MIRALLDTDVILDVLLAREPFHVPARDIWNAHYQGHFEAFISPITPVNVFYIARKLKGRDTAHQLVIQLLSTFRVCPLEHSTMQAALTLPLRDFEDAVQTAAAITSGLDGIVTRNLADYADATIPVYSPPDFLKLLAAP